MVSLFGLLYFSCSWISDNALSLPWLQTQERHRFHLPVFLSQCFLRITSFLLSQPDAMSACTLNLPLRLLTHMPNRMILVTSVFDLWILVTKEKADLLVLWLLSWVFLFDQFCCSWLSALSRSPSCQSALWWIWFTTACETHWLLTAFLLRLSW